MNSSLILRNIARFALLIVLQIVVLNNIYLWGYITPCLYLLFIAMLPTNTGKIPMMIIAFFTGLIIDVSCNMLGFHTFACTAIGFARSQWLDKILLRDNEETIDSPSIRSVAFQLFSLYLLLLLLIFYIFYFTMLYFNLHDLASIIFSTLLSTAVTWIIAILYQTLLLKKK